MRWYELAKIVHFAGLVGLFGFFMTNVRSGARLRAASRLNDVRTWLGVLQEGRRMLHSGAILLLISGIAMIALRWHGHVPFAAIGMLALLSIWALSVVPGRRLRAVRAAMPAGDGPISSGLRAIILAPLPWVVTAAMNGLAVGVVIVMTWKPGWIGTVATVLLASAASAMMGNASIRRERATASVGQLSTAA